MIELVLEGEEEKLRCRVEDASGENYDVNLRQELTPVRCQNVYIIRIRMTVWKRCVSSVLLYFGCSFIYNGIIIFI